MSMNWFTCMTCRVSLSTGDGQRQHYKESWHSYNLKRKLAQLPPVSHQHFQRIEELNQSQSDVIANKDQNKSFYCLSCHKQFNNEMVFKQHIESKKHQNLAKIAVNSDKNKDKVIKTESKTISTEEVIEDMTDKDSDWESVDSNEEVEDEEPVSPKDCLFCEHSSNTIEDNVNHMSEKHSFFIPDIEYLKDLESLIGYLGEKVGFGHYCLWCCDSGKRFRSRRAAKQHMRDCGHSKMNHSNDCLIEYSDFYDYTSSYPDFDANEANNEEEVSIPNLDDEDWQLTLPSGAVIGHRLLFRYYKQNLKPLTENSGKTKSSAVLDKVMAKYRALGWTGTTGETALLRAKDIKFVQRIQRRHELKIGQKHNKVLQKHFRSQIGF